MGSSKRREKTRSKKRKFQGNSHTLKKTLLSITEEETSEAGSSSLPPQLPEVEGTTTTSSDTISASSKKINLSSSFVSDVDADDFKNCYVLFDLSILKDIFEQFITCPTCSNTISFDHLVDQKQGLSNQFLIKCTECHWEKDFHSSKEVDKSTKAEQRVKKGFDVNLRFTLAFRKIRKGHQSMTRFCHLMNMLLPMGYASYTNTNQLLRDSYLLPLEIK